MGEFHGKCSTYKRAANTDGTASMLWPVRSHWHHCGLSRVQHCSSTLHVRVLQPVHSLLPSDCQACPNQARDICSFYWQHAEALHIPSVLATVAARSSLSAASAMMPSLSRSHVMPAPAVAMLPSNAYSTLACNKLEGVMYHISKR